MVCIYNNTPINLLLEQTKKYHLFTTVNQDLKNVTALHRMASPACISADFYSLRGTLKGLS